MAFMSKKIMIKPWFVGNTILSLICWLGVSPLFLLGNKDITTSQWFSAIGTAYVFIFTFNLLPTYLSNYFILPKFENTKSIEDYFKILFQIFMIYFSYMIIFGTVLNLYFEHEFIEAVCLAVLVGLFYGGLSAIFLILFLIFIYRKK
ncbi:hypothetical protein [Acinetobacter sp. c1-l78]